MRSPYPYGNNYSLHPASQLNIDMGRIRGHWMRIETAGDIGLKTHRNNQTVLGRLASAIRATMDR
jgi:hypothetical protein